MNKRLLLTTAAFVAFSTAAFAQSSSGSSTATPSTAPSAAQRNSGSGPQNAGSPGAGDRSAAGQNSGAAAAQPSASGPAQAQSGTASSSRDSTDASETGKGSSKASSNETRGGGGADSRGEPKSEPTRTGASEDRARSGHSADDRAQSKQDDRSSSAQRRDADRDRDTAQRPERDRDAAERTDRGPSGRSERSSADTGASVHVDERQRTRISESVSRLDVRPLTSVNFSVSVGAVIPRDVQLRPLPSEIVEIVPQYRGYDFVVVRDEIVIVEPSSHKIVTVLPYSGRSSASASSRTKFSERDRDVIRRHAKARSAERTTTGSSVRTEIRTGEVVPEGVVIEAFPEEVYREAPDLREYRYINRDSHIYVVEPQGRRVIEEID